MTKRLTVPALLMLLLGGCATSASGVAATEVEQTLTSGKSAQAWATCFAESLAGNNELRGAGDHWWVLRMSQYGVMARWDFRDRPEGGSVAELRSTPHVGGNGVEKARNCA